MDDGGAWSVFHQMIKRVLHQGFRFRVQRRRAFVEQQDRRVAEPARCAIEMRDVATG